MKAILLTITLSLLIAGQSSFAGTDTADQNKSKLRFAKLEATETSWDFTSLIFDITDAGGHSLDVKPTQITYIVTDKSGNDISAGKGIFVSINDTKMESEEDYTITITATIKKEKISKTIYRKASPKKIVLKQYGNSFAYKLMRSKYSSREDYENLNVNTQSMSVDVAFANCKDCATFKVGDNASHTRLTDADSYQSFEKTMATLTQKGKSVQLILQPTVNQKGSSIRYAQSFYQVNAKTIHEVAIEPATASEKEIGE